MVIDYEHREQDTVMLEFLSHLVSKSQLFHYSAKIVWKYPQQLPFIVFQGYYLTISWIDYYLFRRTDE